MLIHQIFTMMHLLRILSKQKNIKVSLKNIKKCFLPLVTTLTILCDHFWVSLASLEYSRLKKQMPDDASRATNKFTLLTLFGAFVCGSEIEQAYCYCSDKIFPNERTKKNDLFSAFTLDSHRLEQ
mmetsp:Transcript_18746/g.38796  ORF Transcript_18746/g.38796 Transcript_18746/m.38796 type:complete len:125 (+) Transcript_18746:165-539(+)